jgi:hypothetical protein
MATEIDPIEIEATFSEPQTLTTRVDCAIMADTTEAEVSTSQFSAEPPPHAEGETEITAAAAEIASTDSIYRHEPAAESDTDSEAVSSAPSPAEGAKPEVNVPHMDIEQLKMHMRKLGPKWEGVQAEITTHHTALGGLEPLYSNLSFELAETLWYAKKRIQKSSAARGRNGGWSQFLREVASTDTLRKSADRLVSGYALYLESVPALQAAIRNAGVSPHTEMIADRVRSLQEQVVTGDLDPDAADFEETCISELRAKPPRATSRKETRRKGGNRRTLKINPPQSVAELRDICLDFVKTCPREVREANPLLVAFAQTTASTKVDDLFRPLIHKFLKTCPPEERQACALNISFIADAALDFVREELNPETTSPEPNSESSASLHAEEDTSAANADPLPDPTVASTPETTAEPRTNPRHDTFLVDEVFQAPPAIGGTQAAHL